MLSRFAWNFFLFVFMVSLPCLPVQAREGLSPRQQEIWQTVIPVDGYLTEEMHSDFWAAMPKSMFKDNADRAAYLRFLKKALTSGLKYQREAWHSVKATMNAGRVVKTPGYEAAKAETLSAFDGTGSKQKAAAAVANGERMLAAVAKGLPIESPDGPAYITPELVDQVLAGMDGSLARAARLMNPVWEDKLVEHVFPDVHVKILWDGEFIKDIRHQTAADGGRIDVTTLLHQFSEDETISVVFLDHGRKLTDPEADTMKVARSALTGMGVDELTFLTGSKWRERHSAWGMGTGTVDGMPMAASARAVDLEEYNGVLLVIGMNFGSSPLEAQLLREGVEEKMLILK
ncbi:hypothetical protein [uncultured Roseibium sp.]|uniref:hypothetical protein n=1 Tax=uncultured Roseibium sp. TaxID=1936171 RepID=UPI003216989B